MSLKTLGWNLRSVPEFPTLPLVRKLMSKFLVGCSFYFSWVLFPCVPLLMENMYSFIGICYRVITEIGSAVIYSFELYRINGALIYKNIVKYIVCFL